MKTLTIGCIALMAACVYPSCSRTEISADIESTRQEKTISFSPFFLEVTHSGIGDIANWKTSWTAASRAGTLAELATTLSYWDYIGGELIRKIL